MLQMDESVISGANLFFPKQFGIDPGLSNGANKNQWLVGLVNSAPYVCPWPLPMPCSSDILGLLAMLRSPWVLAYWSRT